MQEFFEHYFECEGLHLKYAHSAPSVRGQEFHNYCEFVFFLGGKARFISKNIQRDLSVGNVIYIPKNAYHSFAVEGNDYTRCILGFRPTPELEGLIGTVGNESVLIEEQGELTKHLLDGLIEISKRDMPDSEKALYLSATVVHLLFEFQKGKSELISLNFNVSKSVHDALLLIEESYASPITVEGLARELHISPSLLSHKFKAEMNISVYKYVMKKRLSVARAMIESGASVTSAALQSGFSDYACFLRAFKKEYSYLPSDDAKLSFGR